MKKLIIVILIFVISGISLYAQSDDIETLLNRGILFAERKDFDIAIEDFTDALKLDPNLVVAYIFRGRALYASVCNVTDIEENFSSVWIITTDNSVTSKQKQTFEKAIEDFNKALMLDLNNEKIYTERGRVFYLMKEYDKAITDFNQAIRLNTNYALAYSRRGNTYADKKDYDRAIADFNQVIRLDPSNANAYNYRGLVYFNFGDNDRAIASFNQAILLDPSNANVYNNRGYVYYTKRDYNHAIDDYKAALRIDPNYTTAKNNLYIAMLGK